MFLDTTTKSLEVLLSAAKTTNDCPWTSNFIEGESDDSTSAPQNLNGATNGTAAQTMMSAPGASKVHKLRSASVYNADTVPSTVTIRLNDNSTTRIVCKVTLQVGDHLFYDAQRRWYTMDASGNTKTALNLAPTSHPADGRLTLSNGTPVTTGNVTAATSVYYEPYLGDQIAIYDGAAWQIRTFATGLNTGIPATTNTPFDIFASWNGSAVVLSTVDWTNGTTRAVGLTRQNGVLVQSGNLGYRYLGTGRTTGVSGQCEDSEQGSTSQTGSKRFMWNYYNRVPRTLKVRDTTDSWTYATNTIREADGATGNIVEMVIGVAEVTVFLNVTSAMDNGAGVVGGVFIGYDSTTDPSVSVRWHGTANTGTGASAVTAHMPAIGYHYYAWLEVATGATVTFYGDNGTTIDLQSGMHGTLMGG